jgi:hypothetical protein
MDPHKISLTLLALVALWVAGCASTQIDQPLEQKIAQVSSTDVAGETAKALRNTTTLNTDQRDELEMITVRTRKNLALIDEQASKLQVVLIQDLFSPQCDMDEVDMIKARLKDLAERRLHIIYKMIDQENDVMGRPSEESSNRNANSRY